MKKIKTFFCIILALASIWSCALNVFAVSPIDPSRISSLTLQYKRDNELFSDIEIKIYKIADVFENGTYELSGEFENYPVEIYGVTSQAEWKNISQTLASYVAADNITPTVALKTDKTGKVFFDNILPGMYLIAGVNVKSGDILVKFESFITVVPYPNEVGEHNYHVSAFPKSESINISPTEREIKIIKQWKDEGYEEKRPENIDIDIYKDGVFQLSVKLSAENNWMYGYTISDDGSEWHAVERNISEMYKVTVVKNGDLIIITNACRPAKPDTPDTGDMFSFWKYAVLMGFSGGVLLIVAFYRKRREQ